MATRAKRIATAVPDDTSPNTVLGRGTFEPVPFPIGAPTRVTDSEVTAGNVRLRIALTEAAKRLGDETLDRASRALHHHLELIAQTEGWKPIGAQHEHPQLESEPDD